MTTISLAPPLPVTHARVSAPVGLGATTRVRTLMGWQPVTALMAGDLVFDTVGNLHELRGIRRMRADGGAVVRIMRKGRAPVTVGAGQPLYAADWRAQVVFGQATVTPAARLVDGVTLRGGHRASVNLFQLQFDRVVCLDLDGALAVIKPGQ